jgi:uncharacterized protein YggE
LEKEMNVKHTWRIGAIVVTAVLLAVLWMLPGGAPPIAQAQTGQQTEESTEQTRTLSVSGSGQVSAQPDTAIVTVGVQNQAGDAAEALSENSTQMQSVVNALEEAGVAAKDIQTQSIQLRPVYEQTPPQQSGTTQQQGPPKVVGFMATNTVQVRVRKLDQLGTLLDAVVQAGGNQIQGIQFEVSDPSQLIDQARQAAWNDALHKATQLTTLSKTPLGLVLTISESTLAPPPVLQERFAMTQAAAAVPVEPGTLTVEVDLQVTWLLQ